jgi:hypothetical protein
MIVSSTKQFCNKPVLAHSGREEYCKLVQELSLTVEKTITGLPTELLLLFADDAILGQKRGPVKG